MEAWKSHCGLSASQRLSKAGSAVLIQTQRPENEGSRWCESWSKSKGLRTVSADAQGQKTDVPAQAERGNLPFSHLFVLFRPFADWMRPTCDGEQYKCPSLPGTPSETHPEVTFWWLPGHPLARLNRHVKFSITARKQTLAHLASKPLFCSHARLPPSSLMDSLNFGLLLCKVRGYLSVSSSAWATITKHHRSRG